MIEKTGALSEVLPTLRNMVRLSQKGLAKASKVSEGTIRDIETGATVSKPSTLHKLAVALARDPLVHGADDSRVEVVYQRLMVAAGHLDAPAGAVEEPPARRRPVEDLTDEEVVEALTRISNDPRVGAEFLAAAENWQTMAPSAQRFILNGFALARQMDEDIKAAEQRDDARRQRRSGS